MYVDSKKLQLNLQNNKDQLDLCKYFDNVAEKMGRKDIKSYPKKVAEVDLFVKEMDDIYNGDHEKSIKYFQSNMLVVPIVNVEKACKQL